MLKYEDIDAVNWSTLKHLRDSALHYRYRLHVAREDTPAMALGRATHTLVFEPAKFDDEFVIWEGGRRQGKEWEEFRDANKSKTIFKAGEIDAAFAMAEAVKRHPLVQPYLTDDGVFEQGITWMHQDTIRCKAKPDWLIPGQRILLDLKTCRSVDGRRFGAVAARLGYHCQLAHYRAGIQGALGWMPCRVLIVAVENEPPHDVAVFEIDEDTLHIGTVEVQELLARLHACRMSDRWPGRYVEEQALQLPAWVYGSDDEDDPDSFDLAL